MIKKRTHLAELEMDGGATEIVLVREIQWDHLGKEIIHLDFARVSAGESIETEVRIELRGTAPGVAEGGVLEQLIHAIEVTCRADAIPDNIKVDICELAHRQGDPRQGAEAPRGRDRPGRPRVAGRPRHHQGRRGRARRARRGLQPEVIKPERKEKEE